MITFTIPAMLCTPYTGKGKHRVPDVRKPKLKKLIGYYTRGSRPDPLRLSEYQTWKAHVLQYAPRNLPRPSREKPVELNVACYFASWTAPDVENCRKAVVDALYSRENGGDKYVFGMHTPPMIDPENPRIEVTVRVMEVSL